MSLNEKFGRTGSNIRKVQMPDAPDAKTLQKLLSDLSTSASGAQCNVAWQSGNSGFILNLTHSRQSARATWKLFRGRGLQTNFIWEYSTNDVSVISNFIATEMQKQVTPTTSNLRLPALPAPEGAQEERRAININSNLSTKLRKLFIGAQEDLTAGARSAPVHKPPMPEQFDALLDKRVIESVDLTPGRNLLQQLFVNQYGIFSYPTFLFFLEREFYQAIENNSPATVVFFKAINADGANVNSLSPVIAQEVARRIKYTQRKTDILAEVEENKFIVLLPDTDIAGGKTFVRRAEKALFKTVLAPELSSTSVKFAFGLASLGEHCKTLPLLLFLANKALAKAQQIGTDMLSDQDILTEQSVNLDQSAVTPVDLKATERLVSELVLAGIFTYAAFLAFLEHEYYRSARKSVNF